REISAVLTVADLFPEYAAAQPSLACGRRARFPPQGGVLRCCCRDGCRLVIGGCDSPEPEVRPIYHSRPAASLRCRSKHQQVHSHLPDQNFYSCLVGWPTRRKVVVTYHGSQFLAGKEDAKSAGKLWFVKRTASRVVAVSEYLKEMLIRAGFPKDRVIRIYNGIA